MSKSRIFLSVIPLCFGLLSGCDSEQKKPSTDLAAFRSLVDTNIRLDSIRWEVFSTPEETGGVPGPTDYVTLVAEIQPGDRLDEPTQRATAGNALFVVPGAARPWLEEAHRSLLSTYEDKAIDYGAAVICHPITAKLQKTKEPLRGFICRQQGSALIYLTLVAPANPAGA